MGRRYTQSVKNQQDRRKTFQKNRNLRKQVERNQIIQKNKQKQVKKVTQVKIKGSNEWITVHSVTKDSKGHWWTAVTVDGRSLRVNGRKNIKTVDIEVPIEVPLGSLLGFSKIQLRF